MIRMSCLATTSSFENLGILVSISSALINFLLFRLFGFKDGMAFKSDFV